MRRVLGNARPGWVTEVHMVHSELLPIVNTIRLVKSCGYDSRSKPSGMLCFSRDKHFGGAYCLHLSVQEREDLDCQTLRIEVVLGIQFVSVFSPGQSGL
jgi:hypothetical protein